MSVLATDLPCTRACTVFHLQKLFLVLMGIKISFIFVPSHQVYVNPFMRSPRVFSRLSPSSPSLSSYERCSNPLFTLVALCWALYITLMPALYWGAQNWVQYCRCDLTGYERRGRITSLDLWTMLLLMQPRMKPTFSATRAHCWLMVSALTTGTPRAFSAEPLSICSAPSVYWCMGLFLSRFRALPFPLLRSLQMAAQPPSVSATPSSLIYLRTCWAAL